jgi:hypothetical protein
MPLLAEPDFAAAIRQMSGAKQADKLLARA